MPEFILDYGDEETARKFRALDSFTQGYIEAMFFTECEPGTTAETHDPENQSSLPGDATVADISPPLWDYIVDTCRVFQANNEGLLEAARALVPGGDGFEYGRSELDDTRLGQLFWYARNGHGVSFEDDGDAQCLKDLQVAADGPGGHDISLGDDGDIY